jgi:hypothetical protein
MAQFGGKPDDAVEFRFGIGLQDLKSSQIL